MASGAITAYSQAVTPQEGWFIAGKQTYNGKDYWIIDNKPNTNHWYVDLEGGFVNQPFYDGGNRQLQTVPFSNYGWRGFSDWSWNIDNDWILRVYITNASLSIDGKSFTDLKPSQSLKLCAVDMSSVPSFNFTETGSANYDYFITSPGCRTFPVTINHLTGAICYGDKMYQTQLFPISNFTGSQSFLNNDDVDNGRTFDVDGCNINNLYFFVIPNYSGFSYNNYAVVRAHLALSFMVPIDKCPDGLAVGDYWPKLRPLEVEIANSLEGIEQDYYKAMLQYSQINDPSKVSSMNKDLSGKLDGALRMPNIDTDLDTDAISGMMDILGPLKQIFPWLIAGLFVIVLIRRGVT